MPTQMANSLRPRCSRSSPENAPSADSSAILRLDLPRAQRLALGLALLFVMDQLLVEWQPLVVQRVAEALALGPQILLVVRVGHRLDRDLVRDREPVALEAVDLLGVVGEDPDAGEAEIHQDLGADPVVAKVGRQAELEVRVHRVEALLLETVGAQLVEQSDSAALLRQIKQDPGSLPLDHRERGLELLAAVASKRVEDVAGEALGVDAYEHVLHPADIALDHRQMVLVVDQRAVPDRGEFPERSGEPGRDDTLD